MNLNEFKEILNNDLYSGVFGVDRVIVEYTTYGEAFEKSPSFYITLADENGQRTKLATIKNHAVSFGKDFNRIDVADVIFQFANQSQEEQFDITQTLELKKSELDLVKFQLDKLSHESLVINGHTTKFDGTIDMGPHEMFDTANKIINKIDQLNENESD